MQSAAAKDPDTTEPPLCTTDKMMHHFSLKHIFKGRKFNIRLLSHAKKRIYKEKSLLRNIKI